MQSLININTVGPTVTTFINNQTAISVIVPGNAESRRCAAQADDNQRNVCIDDVAGARHTGQHGCAARITTPEQSRQTQR